MNARTEEHRLAEPWNDGRLPGGRLRDPSPIDRGDGSWLWTAEGGAAPGGAGHEIDQCQCVWHEDPKRPQERGWYMLLENRSSITSMRVGPFARTFGLADALRDIFPAENGRPSEGEYLENRLTKIIDQAADERIVERARALAETVDMGLAGLTNPGELIEAVEDACNDRREWRQREA